MSFESYKIPTVVYDKKILGSFVFGIFLVFLSSCDSNKVNYTQNTVKWVWPYTTNYVENLSDDYNYSIIDNANIFYIFSSEKTISLLEKYNINWEYTEFISNIKKLSENNFNNEDLKIPSSIFNLPYEFWLEVFSNISSDTKMQWWLLNYINQKDENLLPLYHKILENCTITSSTSISEILQEFNSTYNSINLSYTVNNNRFDYYPIIINDWWFDLYLENFDKYMTFLTNFNNLNSKNSVDYVQLKNSIDIIIDFFSNFTDFWQKEILSKYYYFDVVLNDNNTGKLTLKFKINDKYFDIITFNFDWIGWVYVNWNTDKVFDLWNIDDLLVWLNHDLINVWLILNWLELVDRDNFKFYEMYNSIYDKLCIKNKTWRTDKVDSYFDYLLYIFDKESYRYSSWEYWKNKAFMDFTVEFKNIFLKSFIEKYNNNWILKLWFYWWWDSYTTNITDVSINWNIARLTFYNKKSDFIDVDIYTLLTVLKKMSGVNEIYDYNKGSIVFYKWIPNFNNNMVCYINWKRVDDLQNFFNWWDSFIIFLPVETWVFSTPQYVDNLLDSRVDLKISF